jgi:serine/threonine protein phosphatase 1
LIRSLAEIMGWDKPSRPAKRARLSLDFSDAVVYAIGDVHGCYDALVALERKIVADAAALPGRKVMIMLGDYVDRGANSARVLDHLLEPPPEGFERICLAGNHEMLMLDAVDGSLSLQEWAQMGGVPTLRSYGIDYTHMISMLAPGERLALVRRQIPQEHVEFLRGLPILIDARSHLFVHAGIRPGLSIEAQSDRDLMFIRSEFYDQAHLLTRWVVHGHTPVARAGLEGRRLNLDTGAFQSGRLTAARISGKGGRILSVTVPAAPVS